MSSALSIAFRGRGGPGAGCLAPIGAARVAALLGLALLGSASGCKGDRYASERPFFAQAPAEQHRAFRALPPERQVRLHLAAQRGDTPELVFCEDFAKSSGSEAIPAILQALADEKDDLGKRALLAALDCARDHRPEACDPRVGPIALTVARSIFDRDARHAAVQAAQAMHCP